MGFDGCGNKNNLNDLFSLSSFIKNDDNSHTTSKDDYECDIFSEGNGSSFQEENGSSFEEENGSSFEEENEDGDDNILKQKGLFSDSCTFPKKKVINYLLDSIRDLNQTDNFNKNLKNKKKLQVEIFSYLEKKGIILHKSLKDLIEEMINMIKLIYISCGCNNCRECKCKKNTTNNKNNVSNFQKCENCKECIIKEKNIISQAIKAATNSKRKAYQKMMNEGVKEILKKFSSIENNRDFSNEKIEDLKNFLREKGFISFFKKVFKNWEYIKKSYKKFSNFIEKMEKLLNGKKSEEVFEYCLKNKNDIYENMNKELRNFVKSLLEFMKKTKKYSKSKNRVKILGKSLLKEYSRTFGNCKISNDSSKDVLSQSTSTFDDCDNTSIEKLIIIVLRKLYENKYVILKNDFINGTHQAFLNYNPSYFNSFKQIFEDEIKKCYFRLKKISDKKTFFKLVLTFYDLTNYQRMLEEAKKYH